MRDGCTQDASRRPPQATKNPTLTVGKLPRRAGVTVSALHFFEQQGLISSDRTSGNQRGHRREMLRRVAFIRVARRAGIPLEYFASALRSLHGGRTPARDDRQQISDEWQRKLDEQIRALHHLRFDFTGCIGCGCLSIDRCTLVNPDDRLGREDAGPRRLIETTPPTSAGPDAGLRA